jgi:hypothetical protein
MMLYGCMLIDHKSLIFFRLLKYYHQLKYLKQLSNYLISIKIYNFQKINKLFTQVHMRGEAYTQVSCQNIIIS